MVFADGTVVGLGPVGSQTAGLSSSALSSPGKKSRPVGKGSKKSDSSGGAIVALVFQPRTSNDGSARAAGANRQKGSTGYSGTAGNATFEKFQRKLA